MGVGTLRGSRDITDIIDIRLYKDSRGLLQVYIYRDRYDEAPYVKGHPV